MRRFTIRTLAEADPERDVRPLFRPLGPARRQVQARALVAAAASWLRRRPVTGCDVASLPGCGRYAADSWAIFVEGRTNLEPGDGHLAEYPHRIGECKDGKEKGG